MARWLVKEEPTHYSFNDLVRDGGTEWSGVHNPLALRHIRSMRKGDPVMYYHSGSVRSIVGLAQVATSPKADRSDPRSSWSVRIRPVGPLPSPVPLAAMKGDPAFAGFDLLRISRLSVMPVPLGSWKRILVLSRSGGKGPAPLK